MSQGKSTERKDRLQSELEASRVAFHTLLDALNDADLKKKSHNATWPDRPKPLLIPPPTPALPPYPAHPTPSLDQATGYRAEYA